MASTHPDLPLSTMKLHDLVNGSIRESQVFRVSTVSYGQCVRLGYWSLKEYYRVFRSSQHPYHFPSTFLGDLRRFSNLLPLDILLCFLMAVLLTLLRSWLTKKLFMPFARHLQTPERFVWKVPENLWKIGYYGFTWLYCFFLLIWPAPYTIFTDPLSVWGDFHLYMDVSLDFYLLYLVQTGFYVHSIYATLYLEPRRTDFHIMMTHHFLAIALLIFALAYRHHLEGVLVMFCLDLCDVFLQFAKLNANLRRRAKSRFRLFHDSLTVLGAVLVFSTWFLFRLYWYPLKIGYLAMYGPVALGLTADGPFYPLFLFMLFLVFAMNVYWYMLLCLFFFKVFTGGLKEAHDIREEDEDIDTPPSEAMNGALKQD